MFARRAPEVSGVATDPAGVHDELRGRLQVALGSAYTLERELGGGGMSRVFVAQDTRLGRRLVVKVLDPDLAAGLSAARFEREIHVSARLQHPHVVPVHASGDVDGLPYYTMPYVQGESLRERLRGDAALPVADVVRLVRELADALAYAHGEGVVHRDLKPENVLLSGGHAVVADFGVAKALASATEGGAPQAVATGAATALGLAVGTPAYMAPEQAAADPATDHRADLYALGVIAYEALAGTHPFAGRSPQGLLAAHLTETPPPLAARRPDTPPALAALVTRLLAKAPDDRPQSAHEVVWALDALATPAGATRAAGPAPAKATPRARRRRRAAIVVGSVAALAAAGAVVWARRPAAPAASRDATGSAGAPLAGPLGPPLAERRVAVAPFENQTGDTTLAALGPLTGDWVTQGLAEAGFAEVADPETIRAAWRSAPNARALAAATGARLVVTGAYYLQGDSLQFLARVSDAATDRVLRALEPAGAPAAAPRLAVSRVRERVLGALGGLLDVSTGAWTVASGLPPSLAAYRRWSAGIEHYSRNEFSDATREFVAATRLDSTFVAPLLWAASAQTNVGAPATVDSLLRAADRSRERLAPADRYLLDKSWAELRGDWAGALRAARELARAVPNASLAPVLVGWEATRVNRPREAVAALTRLDPEGPALRRYAPYWEALTLAEHLAGDYGAELAAARRGRRLHPDRLTPVYNEARALAALGRADDAVRELDAILDLPAEPLHTPAEVMRAVGVELRAHGYAVAADTVFARALRWFDARPAAERAAAGFEGRHAEVLYAAGRWAEARRLFERLPARADTAPKMEGYLGTLAAAPPDAVDRHGYLGALAARRGDRAAALAADSALAALRRPYLVGRHTYWRARIVSLLGDRARAVTLLRDALREGRTYPMLHGEADFAPLHGMTAFQDLIRPKG
jgi:serine/threonine-protein kinase